MSSGGWTAKPRDLIVPGDAGPGDPRIVISDVDPTDPSAFGDILVSFYVGESEVFVFGAKKEVDNRYHLRIYARQGVSGAYSTLAQFADLIYDSTDPSGDGDSFELIGASRAGVGAGQTSLRLASNLMQMFGTQLLLDHPVGDMEVILTGQLRIPAGELTLDGGERVFAGKTGNSLTATTGTTVSGSYVDMPGPKDTSSIVKRSATSRLKVEMHVTAFVTGAAAGAQFGLQVPAGTGTTTNVCRMDFEAVAARKQASGVRYLGGIAAGTVNARARWFRDAGAGTLNVNAADDVISMSIEEVD